MKTEYDLGECPTNEEWSAYFKVERYMDAETVAAWLDCYEKEVTQDEFDMLAHRYGKVAHDGYGDDDLLHAIYYDVMGR